VKAAVTQLLEEPLSRPGIVPRARPMVLKSDHQGARQQHTNPHHSTVRHHGLLEMTTSRPRTLGIPELRLLKA
jgi:hypothetical protein